MGRFYVVAGGGDIRDSKTMDDGDSLDNSRDRIESSGVVGC